MKLTLAQSIKNLETNFFSLLKKSIIYLLRPIGQFKENLGADQFYHITCFSIFPHILYHYYSLKDLHKFFVYLISCNEKKI